MREILNKDNLIADINEKIDALKKIHFVGTFSLTDELNNFYSAFNKTLWFLYEKYDKQFPGFEHPGDERIGINVCYISGEIQCNFNEPLNLFIEHVFQESSRPLRVFELLMSDIHRYVVIGRTVEECVKTVQKEFPHLTLLDKCTPLSVKIPTESSILIDRSGLRYQGE